MHDFQLVEQEALSFRCSEPLASMYKLSPFVWQEGDGFCLLLRVVNYSDTPSEKVARIHYGTSTNGLAFALEPEPVIRPGPEAYDTGGCEDPTVACAGGAYHVYYSGWNEQVKRGELLLASGPDVHHLEKRGIALESSQRIANPKEATIVRVSDGGWRLFFEYANDDASMIGIARSSSVDGPWEVLDPPFSSRSDSWDSWHLSPGPILTSDPSAPVMFYNGATRDARWRVGWVTFDATYTRVVARSSLPLVLPHSLRNGDDGDTDIAFAASALSVGEDVYLYYSVSDRYCTRARIRRS
jgi:predicted GH43/DUF377 family glycosyl hydrolase